MNREDTIGLGTAVGGHALLLALLVLGLWQAAAPDGSDGGGSGEGDGIAVELVSDSNAPAPVEAPEAIIEEEVVEPVQEQPEILPEALVAPTPIPVPKQIVTPQPVPKPVTKTIPKPLPKTITPTPVKRPQTKPVTKPATKPGTGRGARSTEFERSMERTLGGLGGGGSGTKPKPGPGQGTGQGTTTQSAGQIRSIASAAIASEVKPLIPGCSPSTSDNSSLKVFVQMNIGQAKNLISASVYDVQGVTPSNQAQVAQMKKCVLDSLRAASPFNLDAAGYETWRNHRVILKVNFK
jgi:periplasmic protein TonB